VHVQIELPSPFQCTFVYASTSGAERRVLFDDILRLKQSITPWFIAGDFNAIRSLSEASNIPSNLSSMLDFQEFVEEFELIENPSQGLNFTWINNRTEDPIAQQLDRVFINGAWQVQLPGSKVTILPCHSSDHCATVLDSVNLRQTRPKLFKCYNYWMANPGFDTLLQSVWRGSSMHKPFHRLYNKLMNLKYALREFNKTNYSELQK
ncbi:hypothetical protein LINGRAHAP2_LOCUS14529, partial [Linum grandiflorum]